MTTIILLILFIFFIAIVTGLYVRYRILRRRQPLLALNDDQGYQDLPEENV